MSDEDIDLDEESSSHSGFLSKKRLLFFGVIAAVLLLIIFLVFLRSPSNGKKKIMNSNLTKEERSSLLQDEQVKELEVAQKKELERLSKVKYEKLYEQLSGDQAANVLQELSFDGILFKTEQKGKYYNIMVDKNRFVEAQNKLAIKGLPSGGIKGYEIFDNASNMGVTEFDKRIRLVRALSGELEKAIMQINGIISAKVQVVMPEQRLFTVSQPPVTAAILIRKSLGKVVDDEMVYGIIQLVANAVENLQPENVSLVDTDGHVLSTGVFERIAEKYRKKNIALPYSNKLYPNHFADLPADELGLNPSTDDPTLLGVHDTVKSWLKAQKEYEKNLTEKIKLFLMGLLPEKSYKIALSTEVNPESSKGFVIKRTSVGILINKKYPSLYTTAKKAEITRAISGAIGYNRQRDFIQVTPVDFSFFTAETVAPPEIKAIPKVVAPVVVLKAPDQKKSMGIKMKTEKATQHWAHILKKYWRYIAVVGGVILAIGLVGFLIRRWRIAKSHEVHLGGTRETDFSSISREINGEKKIERLREIALQNPAALAHLMEEWLQSEYEEVAL